MLQKGLICLVVFINLACNNLEEEKHERRTPKPNYIVSNATLFWAGVDSTVQSSSVFALDTQKFRNRSIPSLTAESGDPTFFQTNSGLWLFNRQALSLNYRKLARKKGTALVEMKISSQQTLPSQVVGDPHDVAELEPNVVALANNNAGNVSIVDMQSREQLLLIQQKDIRAIKAVKRFRFRPEGLFVEKIFSSGAEVYRLFILHQGLDAQFAPDQSQRIIVLQIAHVKEKDGAGSHWQLLKDQKFLKLRSSNSFGFLHKQTGRPLIVGLCNRFQKGCAHSFERLNPELMMLDTVDFADTEVGNLFYNGQIKEGEDENIIYANVEKGQDDGTYKQLVIKMDLKNRRIKTIHTFANAPEGEPAGGYWGLFFEPKEQLLFVGDKTDQLNGKFFVYRQAKKIRDIAVDAIPYAGNFLYPDAD